jgi:hypothetical protein
MSSVFRSFLVKLGEPKESLVASLRTIHYFFQRVVVYFLHLCRLLEASPPYCAILDGNPTVTSASQSVALRINPNPDGYKKCIAMRLEVIYDFQATNRKLEGLLPRTTTHSGTLLLVAWQSYMTPSRPEWTKIPPETGGCSYFFIKKITWNIFFLTFNKILF